MSATLPIRFSLLRATRRAQRHIVIGADDHVWGRLHAAVADSVIDKP